MPYNVGGKTALSPPRTLSQSQPAAWNEMGGAAMEINRDYAALMLMEILCEKGLINKETMQAARERFRESCDKTKAA